MNLRLYHYWRSSSSWRVRWAFELKGISCEKVAVNLLDDETDRPEQRSRNPLGYVPVLEFLDHPEPTTPQAHSRRFLTESIAIIEWAEESFDRFPLLPRSPQERAHLRRLSEIVNSAIQPLQNPPVFAAVSKDENERRSWCQRWVRQGLKAYEEWIDGTSGRFSFGNQVTMADLYLIPQCYGALRFEIELAKEFPRLAEIYGNALETDACKASHPDRYQPKT